MQNYDLIIESVTTAENMLKDYTKQINIEIDSKGKEAIEQVAEYLYKFLKEVDFPKLEITDSRYWGKAGDNLPFGEIRLDCIPRSGYVVNGDTYYAQLFIESDYQVARIYINEYGYLIEGGHKQKALVFLCYKWQDIKSKLLPAVNQAYAKRNAIIKKTLEEINAKKALVDNFKL